MDLVCLTDPAGDALGVHVRGRTLCFRPISSRIMFSQTANSISECVVRVSVPLAHARPGPFDRMFVCAFGEVCVIKSDMSTVDDLLGEVLDRMGQEIRGVRDTPAADVFAANVPLITRAFRITFVLSPRSESDYSYRLTVGKRVL